MRLFLIWLLPLVAVAGEPEILASGLTAIDNIALGDRGEVYATLERRAPHGRLVRIRNGKAETLITGLDRPDGLVRRGPWLYLTEEVGNGRIIRYDLRTGKWKVLARLAYPEGIVADADGTLWISLDRRQGRVVRLRPGGTPETVITGLNRPEGLCRAADGSLAIAETATGRVLVWQKRRLRVLAGGLTEPDQLHCAANGDILVSEDADPGRIWRIHKGRSQVIHTGLRSPQGLRVDVQGRMYVAEQGSGRLLRMQTRPAVLWRRLERGLSLAVLPSPLTPSTRDQAINVLRIEPRYFRFHLLMAAASRDGRPLPVWAWVRKHGLVAAINASMYQRDHRTSVAYMRRHAYRNNPRLSRDNSFLVFDPVSPRLPDVRLLDRECDDIRKGLRQYRVVVQSIRMISCKGRNVWSPQPQRWSTALIAQDRQGRILFIHARPALSTHRLIRMLQTLPLDIMRAMYVEGGPQAQLYIDSTGGRFHFTGLPAPGLDNVKFGKLAWPVPNVIGISRRSDAVIPRPSD